LFNKKTPIVPRIMMRNRDERRFAVAFRGATLVRRATKNPTWAQGRAASLTLRRRVL